MEISDKLPELASVLDPQSSAEKTVSRPVDDNHEAEVKVTEKVDIKVKDIKTEEKIEEKRDASKLEARSADDTFRLEEEVVEKVDINDKEVDALKKISVYA